MVSLRTRVAIGVLLACGFTLLGATTATADDSSGGDGGLGSGNQIIGGVTAPVTVENNAVSGVSTGTTSTSVQVGSVGVDVSTDLGGGDGAGAQSSDQPAGGPSVVTPSSSSSTSGVGAVFGGNQVVVPIAAPIQVSRNAVSVVGDAQSSSGSSSGQNSAGSPYRWTTSGDGASGRYGIVAGNQVVAPMAVPITVRGNAISVVGGSRTSTYRWMPASYGYDPGYSFGPGYVSGYDDSTSGRGGTGSGNQVVAPASVPVTVDCNAVSVVGDSDSGCGTASCSSSSSSSSSSSTTNGDGGIASGDQVVAPVNAPVDASGNSVSVIGDSSTGQGGNDTGCSTSPHPVCTGVCVSPQPAPFSGSSASRLAFTGGDVVAVAVLAAVGAGLLGFGAWAMLRRRRTADGLAAQDDTRP